MAILRPSDNSLNGWLSTRLPVPAPCFDKSIGPAAARKRHVRDTGESPASDEPPESKDGGEDRVAPAGRRRKDAATA